MVDGFHGLRHYGVVGRDYDDGKVSHLGSAGTHRGEGLVSRGVEERYPLSVRQHHVVGTDVLRDSSGFSGNDVRFPDIVEQGRLSVVDVSHHRNDRRSRNELPVIFSLLFYGLGKFGCHEFHFVAEFLRHEHERLGIEPLVDRHHQAEIHAGGYDLCHRSVVHEGGKVVYGHEFRDFQDLLVHFPHLVLLLELLGGKLPFLPPVLCPEICLVLVLVHPGVGLLDLLLDLLLHLFFLGLRHRLEAVAFLPAFA